MDVHSEIAIDCANGPASELRLQIVGIAICISYEELWDGGKAITEPSRVELSDKR